MSCHVYLSFLLLWCCFADQKGGRVDRGADWTLFSCHVIFFSFFSPPLLVVINYSPISPHLSCTTKGKGKGKGKAAKGKGKAAAAKGKGKVWLTFFFFAPEPCEVVIVFGFFVCLAPCAVVS